MSLRRLLVGGHHELRRPVNAVDESLMRRIEEAREQLRRQGKEIVPVLGAVRPASKPMPRYTRAAAIDAQRA
jgi:hypothetical protein